VPPADPDVGLVWFELLKIEEAAGPTARPDDGRPGSGKGTDAKRVALTGATVALVLGLAGVVAISAASQAAEPSTHKAKTLTFDVVFSPFSPIAANNVRDPNSDFALGDELVFHDQLFA
jgi:hypothetical protein